MSSNKQTTTGVYQLEKTAYDGLSFFPLRPTDVSK